MRGREEDFPLETVEDLILSAREKSDVMKEKIIPEYHTTTNVARYVPKEVEKRYEFSQYLLNPNRYRF